MWSIFDTAWTRKYGRHAVQHGPDGQPELTPHAQNWRRRLEGIAPAELEEVMAALINEGREHPPNPSAFRGMCLKVRYAYLPSLDEVLRRLLYAECQSDDYPQSLARRYGHPLALAVASQPSYNSAIVRTGSAVERLRHVETLYQAVLQRGIPPWPEYAWEIPQRIKHQRDNTKQSAALAKFRQETAWIRINVPNGVENLPDLQ
jgi:hypothetical protein